jgi:hypothetical protein
LGVTDTDQALPVPVGDADERSGYGLAIVSELADDWTPRRIGTGRRWAEIPSSIHRII